MKDQNEQAANEPDGDEQHIKTQDDVGESWVMGCAFYHRTSYEDGLRWVW